MSGLKNQVPQCSSPLIINAPMAGFAGAKLASAVHLAGGLGLVGGLFNMDDLRKELQQVYEILGLSHAEPLPVGLGILPFIVRLDDALPIIEEFRPPVVWLFAAQTLDDYGEWAKAIRVVSPGSKIWVQVGSVSGALIIAKTAQPDVLCLQGSDAGGHGFEKGAGIISLLPEAADTLAREGFSQIPLVASGGIVDGRGVAAALTLGAQGVVMGTRFLAAKEVIIHPKYRAAVLEAHDGGQVTTRSKVFDQLRGPNPWPEEYDGRSLVVRSYKDHLNGVSLEQIQTLHNEAVGKEDKGFDTALQGRAAIWAGTGVGLVNVVESAKDIVEGARKEAKEILRRVAKL